MMNRSLAGKRVLITQADVFMGPVLCEVFAGHGATVIASTGSLVSAGAPPAIVAEAGHVNILIANLAIPAPSTAATEASEDELERHLRGLGASAWTIVPGCLAGHDRTALGEDSRHGQRIRPARDEAGIDLQRSARRPVGLRAGGGRRSRTPQCPGECNRPELRR